MLSISSCPINSSSNVTCEWANVQLTFSDPIYFAVPSSVFQEMEAAKKSKEPRATVCPGLSNHEVGMRGPPPRSSVD